MTSGTSAQRHAPESSPLEAARTQGRGSPGPNRRIMVIVGILAAGAIGGATIGAAARPSPDDRFAAEATILIPEGASAVEVRRLPSIVGLPQVVERAKAALAAPPDFYPHVDVQVAGGGRVLTVHVRDDSAARALAFANEVALQGAGYVDVVDSLAGHPLPLGDFEAGIGAWTPGFRHFAFPPNEAKITFDGPRFNSAALEVICLRPVCGPSRSVHYPFHAHARYRFVAWLRGNASEAVELQIGVPGDTEISRELQLGPTWRRFSLDWVPRADYATTELAVRTTSAGRQAFMLDGVWMADGSAFENAGASLTPNPAESAAFSPRIRPIGISAVIVNEEEPRTVRSALAGAVFGLASALVLVGFAALIREREHQTE